MIIKGNNRKASARKRQPNSAPSSSKSKGSVAVPKNLVSCDNNQATDELDGNIVCAQGGALEGATGDRVLGTPGISEDTAGDDLSSESFELTAITLHQPWASLVAKGWKQYETRDWPTNHRGPIAIHAGRKPKGKQELREHDKVLASFKDLLNEDCPYSSVIAITQLTDVVCMTDEFIKQQSPTELRCGNWAVGRYAFKLENVRAITPIPATGKQGLWKWKVDLESGKYDGGESEKDSQVLGLRKRFFELLLVHRDASAISKSDELEPWNPNDFGELHHVAEADGQLNLLEWVDSEPPEPGDYEFVEQFQEAYKEWAACQTDEAEEELANFGEQELCDQLMDGSIYAAESVQDSPMPESNCGSDRLTTSASGIVIADQSLSLDSPASIESTTSKNVTSNSAAEYSSSLQVLPALPSHLMESDSEPTIQEIASRTCSEESENSSQTLQSSKTSSASSLAPTPPATNLEPTSDSSSIPYPRAGTMRNGVLSAVPTLLPPGVESESLLLRSPGALSGSAGVRPPGKTRLETQLNQLGLIQDGEVVAPEFLEAGYSLPIGWTNLQENRTALELSQVQAQQSSIDHKSESPQETETTETDEKPLEMRSTGELPLSPSSELNISVTLPANVGTLSKAELIGMASEQHQLICGIERKKFKLAFENLYRIHVTGLFLMEFKKRCQYGEFVEQLEVHGINPRVAQNYMMVSKNWEIVEAKAHQSALLSENNESPNLGINWALQVIREEKKQLKSAAPPKDPDSWRTPNTKDQPVVALVQQALGGQIWLDPCSGSVTNNIPCAVRYFKDDNGLAPHQGWSNTVFINPPFSDPFPWVERCCFEFARGNVSAAIMLLKAGTISNVGTGELINKYASAVCHWRGRINFLNDEGNAVKGSDFDCVLIYFGARLDLFRKAFEQRGTIATIDNHYSSVNKKYLNDEVKPEFESVKAEQKQVAAAMGLGGGSRGGGSDGGSRSLLPDRRDFDRALAERYDPHTVVDVLSSMPTTPAKPVPVSENLVEPLAQPEIFDETPLAVRQFDQNTLNDYITAISSNLSAFSNEQIAFLAKIINEESVKRIGF
jgi:hypothetical protein